MSHSIEKIVSHLNQPPYDFNLRLIDFNEKKPIELIQILLLVFRSIDTSVIDSDTSNDAISSSGTIDTSNAKLYHENFQLVKKKIIPLLSSMEYQYSSTGMSPGPDEQHQSADGNITGDIAQNQKEQKLASAIANGDPTSIHPILLYCLTKRDSLQEKLHLEPFLAPIQIPLHITMTQPLGVSSSVSVGGGGIGSGGGGALSDLTRSYEELQEEFRDIYARYKAVKKEEDALLTNNGSVIHFGEISNKESSDAVSSEGESGLVSRYCGESDLKALQDEKEQLLLKIKEMKNASANTSSGLTTRIGASMESGDLNSTSSFQRLLKATSALRKEEDEEVRLLTKLKEQKMLLDAAELKLTQLNNRHDSIQNLHGQESMDPNQVDSQSILNNITREVGEVTVRVRSTLVSELSELRHNIELLKEETTNPIRTKNDWEQLVKVGEELDQEYRNKSGLLEKEKTKVSYSKIAMFQKLATVSATKLENKQRDSLSKRGKMGKMNERLNTLRLKLVNMKDKKEAVARQYRHDHSQDPIELPNGSVLQGHEIEHYMVNCQGILDEEDATKKRILDIEKENLVLDHRIDELERTHRINKDFIRKQEEDAGVKGFHDTQERLQSVQRDADEVNQVKGETLQEISDMVTEMTDTLKRERENLQPLITDLKANRSEFKKIQIIHDSKKSRFDKLVTKLASDRHHLERECERLQAQWKQSERSYHYLSNVNEIEKINLEKAAMEERWKNGDEKMLPDFKCLHDLYEYKLAQQESLSKQLRIEQKLLKESEPENIKQRQLFLRLQKLMRLKLKEEMKGGSSLSAKEQNDNDSTSYNVSLGKSMIEIYRSHEDITSTDT